MTLGLSLLGLLLFILTFDGFFILFSIAKQINVLVETSYQISYFLFLFLLAGSVPFVASTLLQSADYSLLFSSPLPNRSVIAAKLLDATVTNSLQFMVIGLPALFACAAMLKVNTVGWLLLFPLLLLFVLIPALLTAFMLLLLIAILGVQRLRSAISILNVIMAILVCINIVLESKHLPIRFGAMLSNTSISQVIHSSKIARLFPSAWFIEVLQGTSDAAPISLQLSLIALCKIVVTAVVLLTGSIWLGSKLLTAATIAEETITTTFRSESSGKSGLLYRLFHPQIAGFCIKDWKFLQRDSVLLSQLLMPLALYVVPFLVALQFPTLMQKGDAYPFSVGIVFIILFMQTSILSMSSLGLESRSFWVALSAPVPSFVMVRSKFYFSFLFSAIVGVFLTIISGLFFRGTLVVVLLQAFVIVACAAGLCGIGVGISAMFPRFIYENPAHRVSPWALILGFFASSAYIIVSGLLFFIAWLINMQTLIPSSSYWILYLVATCLFLGLTLFCIFFPLRLGAERLKRVEWSH